MRAPLNVIVISGMLVASAFPPPAFGAGAGPPEALVKLERKVGLRIAHARGLGPIESDRRALVLDAERYEEKGEQAMKAGSYADAGNNFERANELLDKLGI